MKLLSSLYLFLALLIVCSEIRSQAQDSSLSLPARAVVPANPASELDWVRVNFKVDGKEERQQYKVLLYVDDEEVEPMLVNGGFIVPPEVKTAKSTEVRFQSGPYDIFFGSVHAAKFTTDWTVGVDTRPFDSDNISDGDPGKIKVVYYINFESRVGDGTRLVIAVPKSSERNLNPAHTVTSSIAAPPTADELDSILKTGWTANCDERESVKLSERQMKTRATNRKIPQPNNGHGREHVTLEIVVDQLGTVECVRAIRGPDILRASAMSAAKQWTFAPYLVNGNAARTRSLLTFEFRVDKVLY